VPDFDPYQTLGVGRKATPDAIKRAYRAMARAAHPDREGGDADLMADVNRAYALLSDDGARARFDATGESKPQPTREFTACELVAQVVAGWLQQDAPGGMQAPDLLPFVQGQLAQHIQQIGAELAKRRRAVAKIERAQRGLTRKGVRATDPIRGVFEQAGRQYAVQIEQLTEQEAVAELALEIATEYQAPAGEAQTGLFVPQLSGWVLR
jgi:curved DNA-binding protein CbpA